MEPTEGDALVRRRVLVSGRVQGVFYRDSCRQVAQHEGVAGWVRNLRDGRVEAVFEGPEDAVDRVVAWCHDGPAGAVVTDFVVHPEVVEGESGFRMIR